MKRTQPGNQQTTSTHGIKTFLGIIVVVSAIITINGCKTETKSPPRPPVDTLAIRYKVNAVWPHDIKAFTEGLEIHNGQLYESTGREKESWIGIVNIKTGVADQKVILEDRFFGEGITIMNNKIYQLTYQTKLGFVYDLKTFKLLKKFEFNNKEGWGMTHNSEHLIMSDGTSKLTYLDTTTLKPVKTLKVVGESGPVNNINELEYVDGFIFANIWETNTIIKIDEQTGKVVGRLDLTAKAREVKLINPTADVMNGLAWHPETQSLLVTGKYWPVIYVIQLQ